MTKPDSGSRQALIERLRYLALPDQGGHRLPWFELFERAAESLRQADEEIERVKKERDNYRIGFETAEFGICQLKDEIAGNEASLSSATLRNEKLREALAAPSDSVRLAVARAIGQSIDDTNHMVRADKVVAALRAALQLSPDPATPQETKT